MHIYATHIDVMIHIIMINQKLIIPCSFYILEEFYKLKFLDVYLV